MFSILTKTYQVVDVAFEMSTFNLIMDVSICFSESASACTIESFPAQAGLMPSPQVQAEVTAPVCPIYQLPQIYNMYCPDVTATACADLL